MRMRWITSALALGTAILLAACTQSERPVDEGEDGVGGQSGKQGGGSGNKAGNAGSTATGQAGNTATAGSAGQSSTGGGAGSAGTSVSSGNAGSSGKSGGSGSGGSAGGSSKGGSPNQGGSGGEATGSTGGGSGQTASDNSPGEGYFVSGDWHGWMWPTAIPADNAETKISPADFTDVGEAGPWCVKGSVAPIDDYSNSAVLGININQDKVPPEGETEAPQESWTPTSEGLTIDFKNTEGTTLRIQIQGPEGDDAHRWCYTLKASGFIKWSDFNTTCWDGKGTAYAKEPISQIMLQVPSDATKAIPFDFCLNSLKDGDSSGGTCNPMSGKLMTQYDRSETTKDCKTYYMVQSNVWGEASPSVNQELQYTGTNVILKTPASGGSGNHNPTSGGNKPYGFPSIFFGNNGDEEPRNNPLPKKMSDITSASTTWKTNASASIGGSYNAAYDIWFNKEDANSNPPTGGYLMVWFYRASGVSPIGSENGKSLSSGGKNFKVWVGPQGSVQVVSYVADSTISDFTFDIKAFFDDAVKNNYGGFQSSWYLTAVMAGWEYWSVSGSTPLQTSDFSVTIK